MMLQLGLTCVENGVKKMCHYVSVLHIIKSLSRDEFKYIRNNTIIVKGFRRVVNTEIENSYHSVYDKVSFCGNNLHSNFEKINKFSHNGIYIEDIKNHCLFVLAPVSEFTLEKMF